MSGNGIASDVELQLWIFEQNCVATVTAEASNSGAWPRNIFKIQVLASLAVIVAMTVAALNFFKWSTEWSINYILNSQFLFIFLVQEYVGEVLELLNVNRWLNFKKKDDNIHK